ncbi:MAG: PAS domain-containing protein [Leptospiraceae bacterium]|nr:PAS domain-containing protein [Leptospiraceae bacterium]
MLLLETNAEIAQRRKRKLEELGFRLEIAADAAAVSSYSDTSLLLLDPRRWSNDTIASIQRAMSTPIFFLAETSEQIEPELTDGLPVAGYLSLDAAHTLRANLLLAARASRNQAEKVSKPEAMPTDHSREDHHNPDLNLYSSLVNALPVLLYRTDVEGRITFANEALLHEMQLSLEDLLGKTAHDFYPPDLAQKYREDDGRVMATRTTLRTIEENVNPADGIRRYVEVIKVPIVDQAGETRGVQGVFWDVTSRVESQRRTESLLAEKQILLRELHHRIRNTIASLSSLISLQQGSTKSPEAREALEEAIQLLSTMSVLYDHLLPGKETDRASLNTYVSELVSSLEKIYGQKGHLELRLPAQDQILAVDRLVGIGIIINELVTNAYKHGELQMPDGKVEIALKPANDHLQITVSDNGKGLPPDVGEGQRRGFGLTLVRMLVDQWGGKLSMENGTGAAIVATLSNP